ncbi:MAG: hypothetical protein ACREM3_16545 [Candidatus Rokuibacteriota bacterium]
MRTARRLAAHDPTTPARSPRMPSAECGRRARRRGRNWDRSCRSDATLEIWKLQTAAP